MTASKTENPAGGNAADTFPSYRPLAEKLKALPLRDLPWTMAAPSWVVPGSIVDNCRFLDGLFDEVALLFLETSGSLAYGHTDLPLAGQFTLDYHVHLPIDLPWDEGPEFTAAVCLELAAKAGHLTPRAFVLHPPKGRHELERFVEVFREGCPTPVLLENIEGRAVDDLPGLARDLGLGLCLDLGHLLAYNQQSLLRAAPPRMVRMLHLNAPGPGGRHAPLTALDSQGETALRAMLETLRPGATVVLELFDVQDLLDSGLRLFELAARWGLVPAHPTQKP